MNTERNELIQAQQSAAAALEAGQRLASRAAARRYGGVMPAKPNAAALGSLLASPAEFWSGAAAVEAGEDGGAVEAVTIGLKYASSRLAVGDLDFARETLLGQSAWAGILAVKLAQRADGEKNPDKAAALIKMALAAQRQSAQAVATAAALNKLTDGVEVLD